MICATFKMKNIKILVSILLVIVVLLCGVLIAFGHYTKGVVRLTDYDSRIAYLKDIDVQVTDETIKTVTIPTEFNEAYSKYANQQQSLGFPDISLFKGDVANLYTYPLEDGSTVELLVCNGILLGVSKY